MNILYYVMLFYIVLYYLELPVQGLNLQLLLWTTTIYYKPLIFKRSDQYSTSTKTNSTATTRRKKMAEARQEAATFNIPDL